MPLSIFNSKKDRNNWWLTWLVSAILLLFFIGTYESFLSIKGFKPSIAVSKDLWSGNRKAVQNNPDVIVLLGASRIQLGMNTTTMRSRLPNKEIVPLAINGQYPMATLQSLAEDETFNGLVLISFMAQMLEPQYTEMQAEYNHYYAQQFSWYLTFDAYLAAEIKSNFRFLHPLLGLNDVINHFSSKKTFPEPFYASIHVDMSAAGDYSKVNTEQLKKHFITEKENNYQAYKIMDKTTWLVQLEKLSHGIKAIQARGGDVVLVRFPTDDGHWQLDEVYYPRAQFWDVMVETLLQFKTIHFKDDEVLRSFTLPDSSHLDQVDTKAFTLRLIELIEDMQLIE